MKTIRSLVVRAALACGAALSHVTSSFAADAFATPGGAGDKNGSSWAHAYDQSQIQSAANALAPGDTLYLGSGTYASVSLTLTSSGEPGLPKSIVGLDTGGGLPLMQGAWSELTPDTTPSGSSYLFRFSGTVSHWVIKDVKAHRYAVALTEVSAGTYSDLTIDNLDADTVRDGITLVSVANSVVRNCDIIRHTKKAFRLAEDVRFVTYENCTADATDGDDAFPTEAFPNGFYSAGNPGIHDITFIDCTARNQRMSGQPAASYWNGDGFSTENNNYNFTYLRCRSFDNDDGGFDDKAKNVTYDSCVAIGNKRAFRYWGSSAIMVNCLGAYSKSWGDIDPATSASMPAYNLWVSGQINVSQSTFHNGIDAQVFADTNAHVILNDCILSVDGTFANGALTAGSVILNGTKQFKPGAGLDADPAYVAAARTWTGSPANAFDSQTYASPEKGYYQATGTANRPPSLTFTALPYTQHMVPFTLDFTPTATDSDGTIASYAWDSGDGATSSEAAPSFVYANVGTFTATCTITDNSGAIAVRTISVRGIKPNAGPDHYVTPTGAGNLDGSSWSNAYSQAELQGLANSLSAGDTIHLGSGSYANSSLVLSQAGTASAPIVIQGVDTGGGLPVFDGTFNVHNSASGSFISFGTGEMSHLTIKNLNFKEHGFVFDMVQTGTTDTLRHHITFENLSFDSIEDAIRLRNASNILVKNCHAIRYTKKAFRIGDYSSFVTFENCSADCNGGDDTFPARSIPNGFFCDDIGGLPIIHDILFVDCVTRNNRFSQSSGSYWNGDGFSSERGAYNITFLRCESYDNHDGGFDNKCSSAVYQDCISAGNSRGFRHWGPDGQMINCVVAFNSKWGGSGSTYGLWVGSSTGELTVSDTTIHDSGTGVYTESGATATVLNSILSTTSAGWSFTSGSVSLVDTVTWRPDSGIDPAYLAPDPAWRGAPANAMDSAYYGTTKGFNSTNVDATPNELPTLSIAATPTSGQAPLTVLFTATANDADGSIVSYAWNFGNGQTSSAQNPSLTYAQTGTFLVICTATDNRNGRTSASLTITVTEPTMPAAVRIDSGAADAYVDTFSHVWAADHSFVAGNTTDQGAIAIANTADDRLYQTERSGLSSYTVLLANGTYTVNLHLAETSTEITAAGQRVFTVTAGDAIPAGWRDIDIFAAAGANAALVRSGTITIADNTLNLDFVASAGSAAVAGIEILPTTFGDTPPAAPNNLAASAITTDSLQLSWSAASDDVGVAGYDVFVNGVLHLTTSTTTANVTDLEPFAVYQLTVRARDTVGNLSAPSAALSVRTQADPLAGYEIVVDNADATGVAITGSWVTSVSTAGFYGLDYLHDDNAGKGTKSVRLTPDIPFSGSHAVYLRWPSGSNRASNVPVDIIHAGSTTTVTVNQRQNGGVWFSLGSFNFDAGTDGSVLIRTTDTNGHVMADAVRFVKAAADTTAPTVPTAVAASNITADSFTLTWTASADNIGVTGYEVFVDGDSYATPTTPELNIVDLSPETNYAVTVRARDAAGNWSALSTPLSVTTSAVPSSNAFDLFVDNADVSGVTITGTWITSTSATGYYGSNYLHDDNAGKGTKSVRFTPALPVSGEATVYLRWNSSQTRATNVPVDIIHANGTTTVTVNQRQNGATWFSLGTYTFDAGTAGSVLIRTTGTNGHVIVDAARFVSVAPTDTEAPATPTGLAASNVASTGFTVTWTASTDNVGVTGYEVFLDGVAVATSTEPTVNLTDLSPETNYSVTVRALDAADNVSALSAPLSVTTAAPPTGGGEGGVIGVNLTDANNSLAPGDIVGVVPAANWNNSTSNNQVLTNVVDDTGTATTVDISFTNTAFAYNNNTAVLADPLTDDAKMMRSQRGLSNNSSMSATAAQVPYATYDVYVYWAGRAASETAALTMTLNFQLWNGTAWVTNETRFLRDTNRAWDGTYDESTAATAAEAVDGEEYVVFRNVTANTFRVSVSSGVRSGICGLQIVEHSATAPASMVTSASSVSAVYGTPFLHQITATENPIAFHAINLPAGLSLDTQNGVISGTPAIAGDFAIGLTITNATGSTNATLALHVARAPQTIAFVAPPTTTFGDAPFALTATASSGLPVAIVVASGPATLDGDTLTLNGAGTVVLTATQAGNSNFLPAAPVEISFDIAPAPQVIAFPNPGPKSFGDAPVTLAAHATSGLPVAYAIVSGPAELNGNVATLTGAGTVTIAATQPGDANTLPATPVTVSFDVAPASAELAIDGLWQLYDSQPRAVAVTTFPANLPVVITYDGSATPPVYPGSYDVQAVIDHPNHAGAAHDTLVVTAGVVVRHAPVLNGRVQGSVHVLTAESVTLNSSASISGDLLLPGTPAVKLNGQPNFGGTIDGPGNSAPANATVTLNSQAALRHLVRRIDPIALPIVSAPPAPSGTRNVSLNNTTQDAGEFTTVRNLTLNSNAGTRAIPPGTYAALTANGSSGFILGVAGATEPAIYNLQNLTLNGNSTVQIVGPVVLTLANGAHLNRVIGSADAPERLLLRVASGGLTLNGGAALHGFVDAPNSTVTINGNATLNGGVASDRLIVNGNGLLIGDAP